MAAMTSTLSYRIGLTIATLALLVFCAWTAGLLLAVEDDRRAMNLRVDALDAVERVQDRVARGLAEGEHDLSLWRASIEDLERCAGRLVPGGGGPRLTRHSRWRSCAWTDPSHPAQRPSSPVLRRSCSSSALPCAPRTPPWRASSMGA
jgi:hypothetical protein